MDLGLSGKTAVNSPGAVPDRVTGRWRGFENSSGGDPVEMGWLAAFLCSERAAFLTGETIRLDGGYGKSLF
jgi:NAD(P)-dependent dehydrogenase (short-subunit alcohol dehydrogenase family)